MSEYDLASIDGTDFEPGVPTPIPLFATVA